MLPMSGSFVFLFLSSSQKYGASSQGIQDFNFILTFTQNHTFCETEPLGLGRSFELQIYAYDLRTSSAVGRDNVDVLKSEPCKLPKQIRDFL